MTTAQTDVITTRRAQGLESFLAARDFLFRYREDYETADRDFRWPQLTKFNWALDYFDAYARGNNKTALWILDENGQELTLSFQETSRRSNQVANFLRKHGVGRWAKHAWSSFFAPWNAGATIFVHAYTRFDAKATLAAVARA